MSGKRESAEQRRIQRAERSERSGTTFDVVVWKIGKARSKTRPHMVRWKVAGKVDTETFTTYALADSFRSRLVQAMGNGEAFDLASGLPLSVLREYQVKPQPAARSWFAFCCEYVKERWKGSAAKTRDSITDGLATAALAMVQDGEGKPDDADLRSALRWAVVPANDAAEPPEQIATALRWLKTRSDKVADLANPKRARAMAYQLTRKLDGSAAARDTASRRRRVVNTAMEYAIEIGELTVNPLTKVKRKRVAATDQVDPRVLVNAVQARNLLVAVSYVGTWGRARGRRLVAFYATLYYAGLRPAEAVALAKDDCWLPEKGWGKLTIAHTLPVVSKQWTDHGNRHDPRGLKQREEDEERPVPIPPHLVRILRYQIKEFGTAKDGLVFGNERGKAVGTSTYSRAWEEARQLALPPAQARSPLAGRPYDLRHTCLTNWINAGVPVPEVARRAGNSVEVIYRRYAGCIDGQEAAHNELIEKALGDLPEE